MEKFALLIGVSEYEPCLKPLPTAIRDAEAMREVLVHPEMGNFAKINTKILSNPSCLEMGIAIHNLFSGCQKDDLVLFFFSGHGITDAKGKLYLSTRETQRTENGKLITPTAIAANYIHEQMSNSRSKRQVVILDSCYSAAFAKGMGVKDDFKVDIQSQLGGTGRAILTSSSSTQYSLYQADEKLSIYTRYLVEGIRTGAADADDDGYISIAELHEYAKDRVAETTLEMTPKIFYIAEEGHWIYIATTLAKASKLKFEKGEDLKTEFNTWLDIAFKYEAEKKTNLLIGSMSSLLADALIQDCFTSCLKKWRDRRVGYFTIVDLENRIVEEATRWLNSNKFKNLIQEQVNIWIHDVLDTLKPDIVVIANKYGMDFEEFQDLVPSLSGISELNGFKVYNFSQSPGFNLLINKLFNELRGIVSIFEGLISGLIAFAALLLFITVAPGAIIGTLIGVVWILKDSQDLPSKLSNILTKDSEAFKNTDLPSWVRKRISDQDISGQASDAKRKLKDQIYKAFMQNSILTSQIVEDAIPEIKQSFNKNLDGYLRNTRTQNH